MKNTFQQQFPNYKDVDWETDGNDYGVDFEVDAIDHKALIAPEGKIIKYKYNISDTTLPEAVTAKITTDFGNKHINDSEILKIDGNTYYQVELDDEPND